MIRTLACLVVSSFVVAGAQAAVTPDEVKKKLESVYPVQVLRIEPGEIDGKPVFLARVMKKTLGGNDAFSVATLAVDGETGRLIPAFRHEASGYKLPDSQGEEPKEVNVPENGMTTWR
jgi:hypothetical protein